jgi:hypothetical protein
MSTMHWHPGVEMKPFIPYIHTGFFPVYLGFSSKPLRFNKELKRLAIPREEWPPFTNADATTHIIRSKGKDIIIVCITRPRGVTDVQFVGLLTHEVSHVWEEIMRLVNGKDPGGETRAYALQWFVQCMWNLYKEGH